MTLQLYSSKGLKITVDGIEVKETKAELSQGMHRIRIEQEHPLYKRLWPKILFHPFRFFGYAFFKTEGMFHKAYNSQAVVWEGEFEAPKDAELSAVLKRCRLNDNFLEEYWDIEVQAKGLKYLSGKRVAPSSLFRKRWLLARLLPCLTMALVFWTVGIFSQQALVVPFVYSALAIAHGIFLFRNRPLL